MNWTFEKQEEIHFDELSVDEINTESTLVASRAQSGRESALSACSDMETGRTDDSLDRSGYDSCDNSAGSSKRKELLSYNSALKLTAKSDL